MYLYSRLQNLIYAYLKRSTRGLGVFGVPREYSDMINIGKRSDTLIYYHTIDTRHSGTSIFNIVIIGEETHYKRLY